MSMDNLNRIAGELQSPSVGMDRLAQYAQGTNPLIPQYMALAEIQRRQDLTKLEPGQASTTTVAQDLVSKALAPQAPMGGMQGMTPQTAPQQAPQGVAGLQAPQGVAALPSGMGQQSFAGGGIVAFDEGSKDAVKDPDANIGMFERFKNYLNEVGGPSVSRDMIPMKDGKPIAVNAAPNFRNATAVNALPTEAQGVYSGRLPAANRVSADADNQVGGFYGGKGPTPTQFLAAHPNITNADVGTDTGAGANTGANTGVKGNTGTKATDAAAQLGIKQADTGSDMFGKYQKLYDEQKAQAAADKEQSKWMRLMEAGLGIMGGTSQYALTNIAQGALPAAKGAASDIATYRKDTADANKELALLNMKQEEIKNEAEKTGITKQHYADWNKIETQKNGILAANANKQGIADNKNIVAMMKSLASSPEGMGKSPTELRAMALQSLGLDDTSGGGGPAAVGTWTASGGYKANKG